MATIPTAEKVYRYEREKLEHYRRVHNISRKEYEYRLQQIEREYGNYRRESEYYESRNYAPSPPQTCQEPSTRKNKKLLLLEI